MRSLTERDVPFHMEKVMFVDCDCNFLINFCEHFLNKMND